MTLPDLNRVFAKQATPYLLLIAAVFVTYVNCLTNGFLFDDNLLITLNENLKQWGTLGNLLTGSTISGAHVEGGFYRPMQMALYFIIYQLTGPVPFGFHIVNIALHAANACLIFMLGRRLKFHDGASLCAALIWVLHPIHTEAVTYMSATADPLFAMLCLLAVLVLFPDFAPKRFFYATGLMIVGILSKEVTVMLPFLVCVTMYAAHPEGKSWQFYIRTWPLWVICIGYTLWRMTTPGLDGPQSYDRFYQNHDYDNLALYADHVIYRIYTFLATLPAYGGLLLWPADLHMERKFDIFVGVYSWLVVGGITMSLVAALLIWRSTKESGWLSGANYRPLAFGILWFGAAHLPDTGIAIPVNSFFLEHWMYLPSAGLFLGMAETGQRLMAARLNQPTFKRVVLGVLLSVMIALGTATVIQNTVWHDPIAFYTHMFKYNVVSARGHNNLAIAYMDAGDLDHAVVEFHKAITTSDTYAETRHNLAVCLLKFPDQQAHWDEAMMNLKRAIEIDPNFYRSYGLLGAMYHFMHNDDEATRYVTKAMELQARFTK